VKKKYKKKVPLGETALKIPPSPFLVISTGLPDALKYFISSL
jgi:hypothetical protein